MTKAEVFQQLIREILHKDCELEEVNGVGTEKESRDSETETDGNVDRGLRGNR